MRDSCFIRYSVIRIHIRSFNITFSCNLLQINAGVKVLPIYVTKLDSPFYAPSKDQPPLPTDCGLSHTEFVYTWWAPSLICLIGHSTHISHCHFQLILRITLNIGSLLDYRISNVVPERHSRSAFHSSLYDVYFID